MASVSFLLGFVLILAHCSTAFTAEAARRQVPAPAEPPAAATVQSNQQFSLDLYREVAGHETGNVFISPYSVMGAMLVPAAGARGETAAEMAEVLRLSPEYADAKSTEQPWKFRPILTDFLRLDQSLMPPASPNAAADRKRLKDLEAEWAALRQQISKQNYDFKLIQREEKLVESINALRKSLDPYQLTIANALWVDEAFPLSDEFAGTVSDAGGAAVFPSPFRKQPEPQRLRINDWVAEQTRGKITDILKPGTVTPQSRLIVTNAIYFKGDWTAPFEESATEEQPFLNADGSKGKCQLMADWRDAAYVELRPDGTQNDYVKDPPPKKDGDEFAWKLPDNPDGWKLLELPYKGDRLSMVVILPNRPDGLAAVEERLTVENLAAWLTAMQWQTTQTFVPKFQMRGTYDLIPALSGMGASRAFIPGGFTGVSEDSDAKTLAITGVIHSTFVKVNEKGTEAAAATAILAPTSAAFQEPPKPAPVFRADHPFVFIIRDRVSGAIVFMGRVMTP